MIDGVGVIAITIAALSVSGASMYVSRIMLPRKMKAAYLRSISVLAAAVETKDSGTIGHAHRVAEMTKAIAKSLGISGKELERIEYAALLRDIGKANVPHAILNKVGALTEEEWDIVKNHSVLGADMVEAVPFLADCAPYVRHHHEHWDGTGYPKGLKGEEIPLGSRILAATSDYDAMISERPYHAEPMTSRQALEVIKAGSGSKYDPVVAKILTDLMSDAIYKQGE